MDSAGTPLNDEFQVNTYTTDWQFNPDVAMDGAGGFVVVWDGYGWGSDTSYLSIHGRRYSPDGTPLGDEFQVNSFTDLSQQRPRIRTTPGGGFIVVWESEASPGTDTDGKSILARRFGGDGSPLGPDFQVNSYTTSWQSGPAVAVAGDGGFVVVWYGPSGGTDTSYGSIQARRFDARGLPLGEDFQVNSYTTWLQFHPAVAMFEGGDFVVAWSSDGSDGTDQSYSSIQARRFDLHGNPLGSDFQVNTSTLDYQDYPAIAADNLGAFAVVWASRDPTGPDPDYRVDGRRIRFKTGVAEPEFLVDAYTTGFQERPAVATDPRGDFVVVWHGNGPPALDPDTSIQGRAFDGLFRDGFEGGDASRWSLVSPALDRRECSR